jgi:hypothetical protein
VSYDDGRVACTDDALVIRLYYFPFGDKRIPWDRPKKSVTVGLAGQPDAEAGAGELQQDLAGACKAATFAALRSSSCLRAVA